MAKAVVTFWRDSEGWGAISDSARPGLGFVHFSNVEGLDWPRSISAGQEVEYQWADDFAQDGCDWRVAWVRPAWGASGKSPVQAPT